MELVFKTRPNGIRRRSSVFGLLRERQLYGRRLLNMHIVVQMPISEVKLFVKGRFGLVPKSRTQLFSKRGGFLGLQHDSQFLVGLCITPKMSVLHFFTFDPKSKKAVGERAICLPDFPVRGVVTTYFSPSGSTIVSLIFDLCLRLENLKQSNGVSTSFELQMHIVDVKRNLHLWTRNSVSYTTRYFENKELPKLLVWAHDSGALLNCGFCLMNVQFVNSIPAQKSGGLYKRTTWSIGKDKGQNKIELDLGESISVGPLLLSDRYANVFYGLSPVTNSDDKENESAAAVIASDSEPPILISRQSVDVEKCIDLLLGKALDSENRKYCGFVDYEADILNVENGKANIIVYSVAEVQVFRRADEVKNEFFLIRFNIVWELSSGAVCRGLPPTVLRQLPHQQAYSSRSWYPLRKLPCDYCDEVVGINNYPMFTGVNESVLSARCGNIELLCSDESGVDIDME